MADARVETRPGAGWGMTDYVVTGEHGAVVAAIEAIKTSYPPAAYGTRFDAPSPAGRIWRAAGSRYTSAG